MCKSICEKTRGMPALETVSLFILVHACSVLYMKRDFSRDCPEGKESAESRKG